MFNRKLLRLLALLFTMVMIASACGGSSSDGNEGASGDDVTTTDSTDEPADEPDDSGGGEAPSSDGACSEENPIKVGFQNPEGDPNGSFPEYSLAAQAGTDYINAELNGLGGRCIELEVCAMAITPDDSQRCANELAAAGSEVVVSALNFFGNHFPIYQGSNIPVIVGTPITIGDFATDGVFAIGAGGGCFGVHTGMIQFATQNVPDLTGNEVNRVAVPWADTPPGVVCYYDLESKPLNVINGTVDPSTSSMSGSNPDLEHIGVPILPASADVTPQATEVLDFEPDVIIYSAQGADCWNFVDALGRLGWTPDAIPLVLSGACTDFTAMEAAGDLAVGVYLTTTENGILNPLEGLSGQHLENATTYQTKAPEYGLSDDDLNKGFAGQGFAVMMSLNEISDVIVADGGEVNGQSLNDAYAATDGSQPSFGGSPLDCAGAPAPYVSVCSSPIAMNQWDGTKLVPLTEVGLITGIDLVAGSDFCFDGSQGAACGG